MSPTLRVRGIPVGMDISWVAITAFVVAAIGLRVSWDGTSAATAVAAGLLGAILLVVAVVGHEVAHALAARARGIAVSGVTLFLLGGYTEMADEPAQPRDEAVVAASGPAASVVMAGALGLIRIAAGEGPFGDVLGLMAVVNLAVAVFNLLPGLPLDGGRLLRALVWRVTGDPRRGTAAAVGTGRVIGLALAAAGIVLVVTGRIVPGIWSAAVGWFLARGAALAGRVAGRAGSAVSAVMTAPGPAVAPGSVLTVPDDLPRPVVSGGRVVGLVPAGAAGGASAGAAMIPLERRDVVDVDLPAGMVLRLVERTGRPAVVVAAGRMVGVASASEIRAFLGD